MLTSSLADFLDYQKLRIKGAGGALDQEQTVAADRSRGRGIDDERGRKSIWSHPVSGHRCAVDQDKNRCFQSVSESDKG